MGPPGDSVADRVRQLVTASPRLATPPAAYFRLCHVLDDPASTVQHVAQIIRTDPSLTARVLRVSNSVAFQRKEPVESVLQAVALLGTNRIRQMALAAGVQETFRGIPPALLDMRTFWEHSIAVALGAEALARHVRGVDPEAAFVAGLLHDIGLLVICVNVPQDAFKVLKAAERSSRPLDVVEQSVLGFDHAQVGAELLATWALPQPADAARFHNQPRSAPDHLVEMVHLADIVAAELHVGWVGERVSPDDVGPSCERLGLSASDLDATVHTLREQVGHLAQHFSAT